MKGFQPNAFQPNAFQMVPPVWTPVEPGQGDGGWQDVSPSSDIWTDVNPVSGGWQKIKAS